MVTSYDDNKLDEKRANLAKMLMASPLIKRKNGRPVELFRRTTAYGG
jgi:hypothetical protein